MDLYTAKKENIISPNAILMKEDAQFASLVKNEGTDNNSNNHNIIITHTITIHQSSTKYTVQRKEGERGLFVFPKTDDDTEEEVHIAHAWRKDDGETPKFEINIQEEKYVLLCGNNNRQKYNMVYKIIAGDEDDIGPLVGYLHRDLWKRAMAISFRSDEVPELLIPLSLFLSSAYARKKNH